MLNHTIFGNRANRSVLLLTLVYFVSRIFFRLAGVVFYGEFVKRLWQSIDVYLLKTALLESLFYAHAQPPLFNCFSGVVLKIFPEQYSIVFHLVFLFIGWLNGLLIYFSLRRLHLPNVLCVAVTMVTILLPPVILYENLYAYTHLNIFLLTLALFSLISFCSRQQLRYWFLFSATLGALVLLRSFYHITWFVIIHLIVLILCWKQVSGQRKRMITLSFIPFIFIMAWLLKNFILFDVFTTSTWMGMNLARIMPPSNSIGRIGPFKPIHVYPIVNSSDAYQDVPLLHQEYKTNSGFVNFYHIDYITVSSAFRQAVFEEIKQKPATYMGRVVEAMIIYFNPSTHAPFIDENYRKIKGYASVINLDFSGYRKFEHGDFTFIRALPVLVLHLVLLASIIICYFKGMFVTEERLVVLVMSAILFYALVAGNMLEYGENNRFRFEHITVFILLFTKTMYTVFRFKA